jgi:hypothetical protein
MCEPLWILGDVQSIGKQCRCHPQDVGQLIIFKVAHTPKPKFYTGHQPRKSKIKNSFACSVFRLLSAFQWLYKSVPRLLLQPTGLKFPHNLTHQEICTSQTNQKYSWTKALCRWFTRSHSKGMSNMKKRFITNIRLLKWEDSLWRNKYWQHSWI